MEVKYEMDILVNIGTVERPCLVPEKAMLHPNSAEGNSWWNRVATGSVTISQKDLDRALKISTEAGGLNDNKQG